MNMISTGAFLNEMDASNKQPSTAEKFAAVWEKKNAKAARAGGVSLMALSLAACGSSSDDTSSSGSGTGTSTDVDTTPTSNALTTGLDTVTGGAGNDSISGSNTTLNAGDTISGGAGDDTLAVFSSAAATIGGFTSTDVETISVSSTSSTASDVVTVNLGSVAGETGLQVTGSSSSVTFNNTDNIAPLTLSYNSAGDAIVTYNASTVSGTADAMTVNTVDTTNGTLTLAGIETLTVDNSGTSTVSTLTTTAATTLNVTGSGTLTLTNIDDATKTIDLSGYTGTSTTGGYGAVDLTITGGSGNDTFVVAMANIDSSDTIVGGDGSDTLRIDDSMTSATDMGGISGIETVYYRNDGTGTEDDTIDASIFADALININAADTNNGGNAELITVSNAGSTQSVTVTDHNVSGITEVNDANDGVSVTVTQKAGVGSSSDVLNLTVSGETVLAATANEYETLNIATAGSAASTVTSLSATTAQNIVITGSQNLTLTAVDMEEQSTTKTSSIDASGLSGKLTMTVTNDEGDQTIKGGSANDAITITGLDADDSIVGNGGTDTLTVADINGDHGEVNVDVERIVLTSDGTVVAGATEIDLRNVTNLERVTIDLNDGTSAIDENVTINNIANGAAVYVVDDFAANTDVLTLDGASDNKDQTINFTVSSGASDDFNADLTANFDSLTFTTASAAVDITIDALSAATLDNLTITGAGDVTVTAASNTTSLDVVNAGSATGAITFTSLARASAAEITLGAGDDTINFVTTSHGANVISAGSGADTIVISGASTSNLVIDLSSTTDQITNVSGAANAAAQTGFEHVTATALTSSGIVLTGSASASTVLGSNQADTITAGSGALTVTPDGGDDVIVLGAGADDVVFEATAALSGTNTITEFTAGTDDLNIGALTTAATDIAITATTITVTADKVYFLSTADAGGSYSVESAANMETLLDASATWTGAAVKAHFVIVDTTEGNAAIWEYNGDSTTTGEIAAAELSLIATVDATLTTADLIY